MSETTDIVIQPDAPVMAQPASQSEASAIMTMIAHAAKDPAVNVDKMAALFSLQERVMARQAEAEFNAAHSRVVAVMPRVPKNGIVSLGTGKGGYNFAKWEDIDRFLRPLMIAEGFSLIFDMTAKEGGGAVVAATLRHSGGHSVTASIPLALDAGAGRNNLQAMGSTLSYGKRYLAEMLFNIVREGADDDGRAGGKQYLSDQQKSDLLDMLASTSTDIDRFFTAMNIDAATVGDIDVEDFPRLMNALRTKAQRMKGTSA